jgi:signal transduction histidine kinase/ligand-binding sensor domain-containing protein
MGMARLTGASALSRLVAFLSLLLLAPYGRAERLPVKTYTTADGLAQDFVNQIVRDSRGYLWFCTAEGLSRFDGYRFTNYTTDQGLPHRSVRDLLETRSRVYWIATGDGLCRFNPNGSQSRDSSNPMFVVYRPDESPQARSITVLYEDHAGTIWVGTAGGLYRLEESGGQVNFHFVDLDMPTETAGDRIVESILEDRRGALWVGARRSGLYRRLPDGGVEHYTTRQGLASNRVSALLEDREGRLWAGIRLGLCLLVAEPEPNRQVVARVYTKKKFGLNGDWVEALHQTSDGRIWLGIDGGLSEFTPNASGDEQKFKSYATAHGLSHLGLSGLTSLAEDSAGNLWIGTSGGGVMKLVRNGFITYTEAAGARSPFDVGSIFESGSGELYFTGWDQSAKRCLIRHDEKGLSIIRPNFPKHITNFADVWNQVGFQDHLGEWWIATGQGLCRFPKVSRVEQLAHTRPKAVYTTKDGLIDDMVWHIYEDSRGDIWVASWSLTQYGLARWERATETFHRYTEADGLPPGTSASAFCEDASGNVWISDKGTLTLTRYAAGRFTVFTTADGLPASAINALHLDPAGRLWIATDTGGLSRVDNPTAERPSFVTYTTAHGLSSNMVGGVTSDRWGRIYASTGRGLDRLDPATGQVRHFTTADGLAGYTTGVAFRDHHGALWFGSDVGVSRLIPELDSTEPPPILISGVRIAGELHPLSELGETVVPEIRLGPSENQIQIDFVGLSFGTGEQLRYQYKLEGADADWSAPSDGRSVNYARLSPGSYRFLVRAVTSEGTTSQSPASVSFTILPPIWQRWWFLASVAIVISLAAYSLYRYRLARLIELERVRTRIATDLHDDIGANLSLIAMASDVARRQSREDDRQMTEALSLISGTSRELVDSMGDIVWAVNPSKDHLSDLTRKMRRFASDVFSASNIAFHFQAPGDEQDMKLGTDTRREVFLIFKEGVNNIARHSECNRAEIELQTRASWLVLKLTDDGKGVDPTKADDGSGLASMRQRAVRLGGKLAVESGNGQGTTVTLEVPIGRRSRN